MAWSGPDGLGRTGLPGALYGPFGGGEVGKERPGLGGDFGRPDPGHPLASSRRHGQDPDQPGLTRFLVARQVADHRLQRHGWRKRQAEPVEEAVDARQLRELGLLLAPTVPTSPSAASGPTPPTSPAPKV